MRRLASIVLLAALASSSAAQPPVWPPQDEGSYAKWFDKWLSDLHIDEIVEAPGGVTVRATPSKARGRLGSGVVVMGCSSSNGMLMVWDHDLKTDDRWILKPVACDALLAAALRRTEAQGR